MRTENDIRAALSALAEEAPKASNVLSALPSAMHAGLSTRPARRRRRVSRLVTPVAAAAAVAAIAGLAASLATGTGGHRGGRGAPSAVTPGARAHGRGVPPYYLVIMAPPGQSGLVATVRDTRTGAMLATVQPPKGYWFIGAAPGPGGDSFVLEANQHNGLLGLFWLRFNPADHSTRLSTLPIPVTIYTDSLAVSPSGTELAVSSGTNTGKRPSDLQIYTLSGRLVRQWQSPGTICLNAGLPCLSWAASGYLAFSWTNNGTDVAEEGIRLIRTTAASGSLLGASRLVVSFKTADVSNFVLSGDGARIAAGVVVRPRRGVFTSAFEEFSAVTGKVIGRYWLSRPGQVDVGSAFWSNWSGSALLVTAQFPRTSRNPKWPLGILTGGSFHSLPTPAGSWFAIAF